MASGIAPGTEETGARPHAIYLNPSRNDSSRNRILDEAADCDIGPLQADVPGTDLLGLLCGVGGDPQLEGLQSAVHLSQEAVRVKPIHNWQAVPKRPACASEPCAVDGMPSLVTAVPMQTGQHSPSGM